MDFDNAKENIQPLASGRNVSLLQASLCQDASQELSAQRKQLELDIKNYKGDDPLEPWYNYICWIEQSYPAGGSNSGLQKVMHKCLALFEQDKRYKQDRRLIKLFIKFMGSQGDEIECYQQMYNSGIGTMLADFYIAWAYSYDLSGNMRKANEIFRLGVDCRAEPLEDLKEAQQHFGYTVAQRMLYTDGEETVAVKQELDDRRLALRSLRGQKRQNTVVVGSVRTGAAIKSNMPGVVQSDAPSTSRASRNAHRQVEVFNDENADQNVPLPPPVSDETEAAGGEPKSSLRSIIDAARQQENLKEPIAWSQPHKRGKIFSGSEAHDPAFPIHVDEKKLPPIKNYERNFDKPFKYLPNFVAKNKPQQPWITPVTIEDEPNSTGLPCYNKIMTYPRPNMEFSPEEYRAYCWFRRRDDKHPFVLRHNAWWGNGTEFAVRRYPNFANSNKPQAADEMDGYRKMPEVASLKPILDKIYNDEEQQEYQFEEIMAANWHLKRNNTVHGVMDMEETVCLPGGQMPRRKSFFPSVLPAVSSKSILPQVSCVMEENEEQEEEEEEQPQQQKQLQSDPASFKVFEDPSPEKKQINRVPIKIFEDPTPKPVSAPRAPSPAAPLTEAAALPSSPDSMMFAMPMAPPANKIEIFEDDPLPARPASNKLPVPSAFFDADETCSTQTFNIFLKSQAVSTPKAAQKQAPARQFGTILKDVSPTTCTDENSEPETTPLAASVAQPVSPMMRKQLSTILETSEHGTHGSSGGTNATTKSTLISTSTSPGSHVTTLTSKSETLQGECTPGPTRFQRQMVNDLSVVGEESGSGSGAGTGAAAVVGNFERLQLWEPNAPSVPMMKSLRFQEDKTETVTRPLMACYQEDKTETLPKLPMALPDLSMANASKLYQPSVPQLPPLPPSTPEDKEDKPCSVFAKTPARPRAIDSPLFGGTSKRSCNQKTPDMFSKSSRQTQKPVNDSLEMFDDVGYSLPLAKPTTTKPLTTMSKLADSFMADLSFIPETQKPKATPALSQSTTQKKFEICLDESMPPPPLPVAMPAALDCTVPETQPQLQVTIGPAHLTASFMKDCTELSACPLQDAPPLATNKFDIFLNDSLPEPPQPAPPAIMDCTVPETQPELMGKSSDIVGKLETIGPAHLTASFMKDCTELSKGPTTFKFQEELEKSVKQHKKTAANTQSDDYFELNAATEMFASNISMIKNSTLLPEAAKKHETPAGRDELPVPTIVVNESHDDQCIYYKTTPLTPKLSHTSWHETSLSTPPRESYVHRKASIDESVLNSTLAQTNVNPFSVDIINSLLDSIEFSQYIEKLPNCQLMGHVKRLVPHSTISVHKEEFEVQKIIGKGAYGSVYSGVHRRTGKKIALKQEKPTNYWEYYICLEVQSRLANEEMIAAFMHIDYALVGHNSSVYISELSQYGSLINICNKYKKQTNKNLDEYVVMNICCQLLDIVDHLHALGIIHADIKADNFLLMKPLSTQPKELSLQLIDFGVAIDTKLFPPNQTFDYVHNDDTFKCIEMRTQRRWTYQLDLFGLVGVMHVLLFGRYMEVTQRQTGGIWMPKQAFPRYFNRQTWESVFRTLLNVNDCRSMPNLQELRTLFKLELAEKEKYVEAAIAKFNLVMQRQSN